MFSLRPLLPIFVPGMTEKASSSAFKQAHLQPSDVDVVELHDCFSTNELITYEALGLCAPGLSFHMDYLVSFPFWQLSLAV